MCSPPTDARRKARTAARASTSISAPPIGKADEDAERRAAHTHGNAPSSTCIPAADGARRRSRAADYSESSKVGESSTCLRAPSLGKRLLPWCTTIFSDVSLVERKANMYGLFDEEEEEEEE
uniref:Uncharacterized protein n=1 Tax=Oryza barthii TaxID=65489 RepID=A0A0D3ELL3_9ORYZ